MKPLNIYNLFPRLYKSIKDWENSLDKINGMGFNSIFINPFHLPGFSESIYAVKDYYDYNKNFFTDDAPCEDQLKHFLGLCTQKNITMIMDLVVNHSSIDCNLIEKHKDWYKIDENGELERPGAWENGRRVTWGDLATFNLDDSPDRENLWNYFYGVCKHYLDLGFKGFRCDAAYQISADFWTFLISKLKGEYPDIFFLAETLGCTPIQIQSLSNCGFDYIFNSSKWWNYNDPWCLEQSELTRNIAPSISFPETHDTPRLMFESMNNEPAFLQRLYFEAIFSKGFMITTGFEYGFTKRIDTVNTKPSDWENTGLDYSKKIKRILEIKMSLIPFHEESTITIIEHQNWMNVFCFVKIWENTKVIVILNKDINKPQHIFLANLNNLLECDKIRDYSPEDRLNGYVKELNITLKPCELKIFACEKDYSKSN